MNYYALTLIVGLGFVLAFGGLSLLRREGLSAQFAFEVLAITGVVLLASWATGLVLHPVLFLAIVYLISMRSRLLVDLGNLLSSRGHHDAAASLHKLALRLWPDAASRLVVLTNYGAIQIRRQRLEEATTALERVLTEEEGGHLGLKYESACRYNLGVAYRRSGREADAVRQFREVIDLWPASIYALRSRRALKQGVAETEKQED